jgi:arylsulfatase A-like enzyme
VAPTLLELAGVPSPGSIQGRSLVPLLSGEPVAWRDAAFAENLWSTAFGNPRCESVRTAGWKYLRYFENDRSRFRAAAGEASIVVTPGQAKEYARWLTASIRGEEAIYEEVFDLEADPDETTNLVGDPRHADVLADLRGRCRRLVREAKGDLDAPPLSLPLAPDARKVRGGN